MSLNNRASKRQEIGVAGTVCSLDRKLLFRCSVRNVSDAGAMIEIAASADLPEQFILLLTQNGAVERACTKVWRIDDLAGLRFVTAKRKTPSAVSRQRH